MSFDDSIQGMQYKSINTGPLKGTYALSELKQDT